MVATGTPSSSPSKNPCGSGVAKQAASASPGFQPSAAAQSTASAMSSDRMGRMLRSFMRQPSWRLSHAYALLLAGSGRARSMAARLVPAAARQVILIDAPFGCKIRCRHRGPEAGASHCGSGRARACDGAGAAQAPQLRVCPEGRTDRGSPQPKHHSRRRFDASRELRAAVRDAEPSPRRVRGSRTAGAPEPPLGPNGQGQGQARAGAFASDNKPKLPDTWVASKVNPAQGRRARNAADPPAFASEAGSVAFVCGECPAKGKPRAQDNQDGQS